MLSRRLGARNAEDVPDKLDEDRLVAIPHGRKRGGLQPSRARDDEVSREIFVLSLEIKGVEIGRKKNRRRQLQTNCPQDQHLVIDVAPEDADRTNIAFIYFFIFALKLES